MTIRETSRETPGTPRAPSPRPTAGIHHVTALATDPRQNVEFYTDVLGLRLVKRTVNFDDPGTYHLYYGDEAGSPGTLMTFFPWPDARRGTRGTGQATVTAFAVPEGSLGWWSERLAAAGIVHDDPTPRFDGEEEVLTLLDPDGLKLELVADGGAAARAPWADGPVPAARAIRGFQGVTLSVAAAGATRAVLQAMGYERSAVAGARERFLARGAAGASEGSAPGVAVDLLVTPETPPGRLAAGTVHHVAFRAVDDADQLAWRDTLGELGLHVTPVRDRQYFHSIYFREPGGVLFEIATDPPGMLLDEPLETLGSELKLPPWVEPRRAEIEGRLPTLPSLPSLPGPGDSSATRGAA